MTRQGGQQQLERSKDTFLIHAHCIVQSESHSHLYGCADLEGQALGLLQLPWRWGGLSGEGLTEVLQQARREGAAQQVERRLVVICQQSHQVAAQLCSWVLRSRRFQFRLET